jgi:FixJ family two-component response regulator
MTGYSDVSTAVSDKKNGAADYIQAFQSRRSTFGYQ